MAFWQTVIFSAALRISLVCPVKLGAAVPLFMPKMWFKCPGWGGWGVEASRKECLCGSCEAPRAIKSSKPTEHQCLLFTCRASPGARTQGARFSSPAAADRKLAIREDREDKPKLQTVFIVLRNHISGPARTSPRRQQ